MKLIIDVDKKLVCEGFERTFTEEERKILIRAIGNGVEYVEPKEGEWIPVSERLPETYEEVIVTDIETINTYQSRYIGNGYWECDNGTYKNRIIAWQPFPERYKEAENG